MAPGQEGGFTRWAFAFLGWVPIEKQARFGESIARLLLLICGIRFGKTDCLAVKFLYAMFFTPNGRFLNTSFSQDQANIVVERAYALAMSGPLRNFIRKYVRSPYPTLVLKNGAQLQSRSTDDADLLRGKAYHGIGMDEGAFARRQDADILLGRTIDYAGWLAIVSTPPLMKNWTFEWWVKAQGEQMKGSARYFADTGTTYDNPRIPVEEIDALRERYTELGFLREVMGEFVDNEGATFPMAVVQRMFQPYEPESAPRIGKKTGNVIGQYLTGWDFGRKTTLTVGTMFDISNRKFPGLGRYQMRGVWRNRLISPPWPTVDDAVVSNQAQWNASVAGDATGVGDVVIGNVNCAIKPVIFTPKSRAQMIIETQKVSQTPGAVVFPDHWTELRTQFLLHTWAEDAEGQTWDDFDSVLVAVHHAIEQHRTLGFSVAA